ncbi:AraC family transcriptional regulator [Paraburkholderia metrosideri]|jgi:AraC-like DNA-binding protein/mannose-6-phosphate isomerase-like protein (cupin superfamily)|uniref:HTH-type transcriptional regulator NimR n=1 Tax=Paraburkholderia metrosideri TaxID=580937 RepID=A0ABN7I438_9BURK|nr:helix-turn-helix transcriptional regulator [Paraburkholderia metrosideri]CAD6546995.1 HTH-type transcriptional regulator NimR [Paraburkholderia metrosideri]
MDNPSRNYAPTQQIHPVAVIATDPPGRTAFPSHAHRQGQLIYAISGVMIVRTDSGSWVVPTGRAVWVPGDTQHAIETTGDVRIRTVFVKPGARKGLPDACRVILVSTLLRELIVTAADIDEHAASGARARRIMALILDEIEIAPTLSLHVPMPRHAALVRLCTQLINHPSVPVTLAGWAREAHMNERTLARTFRRETGMTQGAWCRHTRLLLSLPRLVAGASILEVALEHGYDSPSAFAAMFRKTLGVPPSEYFRNA